MFDVTIETIVSIVTSNLIGQNPPVNSRLNFGSRQNFFIQLGPDVFRKMSDALCERNASEVYRSNPIFTEMPRTLIKFGRVNVA